MNNMIIKLRLQQILRMIFPLIILLAMSACKNLDGVWVVSEWRPDNAGHHTIRGPGVYPCGLNPPDHFCGDYEPEEGETGQDWRTKIEVVKDERQKDAYKIVTMENEWPDAGFDTTQLIEVNEDIRELLNLLVDCADNPSDCFEPKREAAYAVINLNHGDSSDLHLLALEHRPDKTRCGTYADERSQNNQFKNCVRIEIFKFPDLPPKAQREMVNLHQGTNATQSLLALLARVDPVHRGSGHAGGN